MRKVLVMSTGLLLGCAAAPDAYRSVEKGFIDIGVASFAVFTQKDEAFAVYLGDEVLDAPDWIFPVAQKAIERATGCPVLPNSVVQTAKVFAARLSCAQSTSIFVRAMIQSRGKTVRSGTGPPAQYLTELRKELITDE